MRKRLQSWQNSTNDPWLCSPVVASPNHAKSAGANSDVLVSLLDVTPTILDWFNVSYPTYDMFENHGRVKIHGKSLLPLLGMHGDLIIFAVRY